MLSKMILIANFFSFPPTINAVLMKGTTATERSPLQGLGDVAKLQSLAIGRRIVRPEKRHRGNLPPDSERREPASSQRLHQLHSLFAQEETRERH